MARGVQTKPMICMPGLVILFSVIREADVLLPRLPPAPALMEKTPSCTSVLASMLLMRVFASDSESLNDASMFRATIT